MVYKHVVTSIFSVAFVMDLYIYIDSWYC